jgi:hypothetical protein
MRSLALLVACLASFRTLFTAKTRQQEDAHYRADEEAQRDSGPDKKHLWARAKYFQDSLFSTNKDNTLKNSTVMTKVKSVGDEHSIEFPLRETKQHSIDSGATAGSLTQYMPTLNSHGLLGDRHSMDERRTDDRMTI